MGKFLSCYLLTNVPMRHIFVLSEHRTHKVNHILINLQKNDDDNHYHPLPLFSAQLHY